VFDCIGIDLIEGAVSRFVLGASDRWPLLRMFASTSKPLVVEFRGLRACLVRADKSKRKSSCEEQRDKLLV
jgi:hypothetical protein